MLAKDISAWLNDYIEKSGMDCFVVGVSGGVDSALTSTLCAQTGRPTHVLNLPINSKSGNTHLSDLQCKFLTEHYSNVIHHEYDASTAYMELMHMLEPTGEIHELSAANTKSRLRMVILYYIAGKKRGVVVGTGNKVEDFGVGFFTKYGDGGVDISPIADLSKTEVRELASLLGVPHEILDAPPTDGLWEDDRTDESQIGASYEELEWAMEHENDDIDLFTERQKEVMKIYMDFHARNLHKMNPIPIFKKMDDEV